MSLNLLFEYPVAGNTSSYRCIIQSERSRVCRDVQFHLKKAGFINPAVFVLSFTTNTVRGEENDATKFYLQKWNSEWNCFVNVDCLEEIKSGDKLSVVKIEQNMAENTEENTQTAKLKAEKSRKRSRTANDVRVS